LSVESGGGYAVRQFAATACWRDFSHKVSGIRSKKRDLNHTPEKQPAILAFQRQLLVYRKPALARDPGQAAAETA